MKHLLRNSLIALGAACALPAAADTVTLWDFNADLNAASVGSGTASVVGATQQSYSGSGSSDPQTGTADKALGMNGFPAVSVGNKTAGAEFKTSTEGFVEISVTYEIQRSGSGSRFERFQYSLNGTDFIDADVFSSTVASAFAPRTVDLSGIAGVENNPNFAFRIVSEFESTATGGGASSYVGTSSSYGTTGTWRFDMVGVSGTSVSPVPEPTTAMLGLVGAGALALRARRRN